MRCDGFKLYLLISLLAVSILFSINFVLATSCWEYSASATCTANSSCMWKNDSWGGWCQEKNCWSFYTSDECNTGIVPGKNCTWQSGSTNYYCTEVSCWTFSGQNQSYCVNNSAGLSCSFDSYCYSSGYAPGVDCWSINSASTCSNTSGCSWGSCNTKGCGNYNSSTCNAGKDWRGNNCTWDSSYNYCKEKNCWEYSNQTACNTATGINCNWKYSSCQDVNCWTWDGTDAATCVNNSANLSCKWDGQWCMQKGCWDNSDATTCQQTSKCAWTSWSTSGMCEEVNCWLWDAWKGGTETACVGNASNYGLSCTWKSGSVYGGSNSSSWCEKDYSTTNCSGITTEKTCMDTYYCWWQYIDWNNPNLGGACSTPDWATIIGVNNSITINWNPGCYVFDNNASNCGNILGCDNSTMGICSTNSGHDNSNEINTNGVNCTMVNSSSLCNNIPVLSSCCVWQNGSCTTNNFITSCRDQIATPPAESCEGANNAEMESTRKSSCDSISNDPWYMPCKWNNNTKMCEFKSSDVFGNGSKNIIKLENKRNCEAAGGKWLTENYCEGNISVPTGRCEYKFDDEDNCNKACFGCEKKNSNGNIVNATSAREACIESTLGNCEFTADTSAPNEIGYCKAKRQFKYGLASDCDSDCGDCTFKGNPISNDSAKRPSYYCSQSKANSDGGGCKWITDNSTTRGYCVKKGEKTCEDSCDRCYIQTDCSNTGRTAIANQSGSCKWQGDSNDGFCVANIGEDVEICWNAEDDDDDGLIDCADPACYSDSYCGFVSGDCFIYNSSAKCNAQNISCEWTTDKWGSWCDFKGSNCWKNDANESTCNTNDNCQWSNGTGAGWCERDWAIAEVCMNLNRGNCSNTANCVWTNDTWCSGFGNGTDWCDNYGGWCDHVDFAPKNCWNYQTSSSQCNNQTGCSWQVDSYSQPHCEINWSSNCWENYDSPTCTSNSLCTWRTETWGSYTSSWCDSKLSQCWGKNNQSACQNVSGSICTWRNTSWGAECTPVCFNSTLTTGQSECDAYNNIGCYWKGENGWCSEQQSQACYTTNVSSNSTGCLETSGCKWRNPGWCDPKGSFSSGAIASGGGMGGSMGADCWKYDGNQTLCTNKTIINISCGWMPEQSPRCEVNWNQNCWQYNSSDVDLGCNSTNGCWWNPGYYGGSGYCTNMLDQCWSNISYQSWNNSEGWAGNCSSNYLCTNTTWNSCEPRCFSLDSTDCVNATYTGKCKWMSGWCSSSVTYNMYSGMESGSPAQLGSDICDGSETPQASVDLCGFGMKDMGNAFGFGANVLDFSNASICNKEKISSFVMGMVGGEVGGGAFAGGMGSERTGAGNETIKFFVYLDTDGLTTGNCKLDYNDSSDGYEFKLRYVSEWNSTKEKAIETFASYKCDNNKWVVTDIKLSVYNKKMCSEIGGPIIAVEKNDLVRFPLLYNSTKDIRIAVSSAGANNNATSPSDTINSGWATPGSIDFSIDNAFSYGADSAKFEDILKKGFVQYEDCFNGIDDDSDGNIDCNDWSCQYSDQCTNTGVNALGFADTSMPVVTGIKIEEYYDSALIMYDTNKPTNGTLQFYKNDSTCLSLNKSIYDVGILKSNVRNHKLWHSAEIYNNADSLSYALINNTQYFYKIKVCDSGGKCAISKCSNFTTAQSSDNCGYCNFVTRLKIPSDWNVSYDVNQDGTYEHLQGQMCGPKVGMKTDYSSGRKVNIKLSKSDGSVYMEFLNTTLTKTGLNDKVRTMSSSGDLIYDTSTGSVGMISETRDKVINNLHPEICKVKIPFSGTCNSLFHCDDNGQNCTDRTSDANLTDPTNCVWQLPYCEFSTWDEDGNPSASSSSSSSSGGGGGGGGGGGAGMTYTVNDEQFKTGYTKEIKIDDRFKFSLENETHYVKLIDLTTVTAKINVSSETQQATLAVGDTRRFELNTDDFYDLSVKLNDITVANNTAKNASITIQSISEKITPETIAEEGEKEKEAKGKEEGSGPIPMEKNLTLLWIVVGIIVVGAVIFLVLKGKNKKRYYEFGL